ncbi:hypothetical protein PYCCODRAFT_358500 [Trametes coccinea BRFM310]|uniref:Uncharacterized protein n=1 Tax=Trametes coccinea (strain BRFM310) TaxID=1353009 RepID=A0A1Y2J359_TRAC3|nr:hypothetical protein PYCCODRAFT_358500 [Trametes coccinea BRFM310]
MHAADYNTNGHRRRRISLARGTDILLPVRPRRHRRTGDKDTAGLEHKEMTWDTSRGVEFQQGREESGAQKGLRHRMGQWRSGVMSQRRRFVVGHPDTRMSRLEGPTAQAMQGEGDRIGHGAHDKVVRGAIDGNAEGMGRKMGRWRATLGGCERGAKRVHSGVRERKN